MATIFHVADLHLDRAFQGQFFFGCDGARRRQLLRRALEWVVDTAKERRADLLSIGGDLFENEHVTSDTIAFVTRQLARFSGPVLLVSGNHDCAAPSSPYHTADWPSNVTLRLEPETRPLELDGMVVWGLGYSRPEMDAGVLQSFHVLDDRRAHILVVHGVDTAVNAPEPGRLNMSSADVEGLGLDHVLLGHIHAGRVGDRMSNPGVPVPLDPGDVTGNHGALWVAADGEKVTVEPVALDLAHFVTVSVDAGEITDGSALEAALREHVQALPDAATALVTGRLLGRRPDTLLIDTDELAAALAPVVLGIQVVDATDPEIDLAELSREENARGKAVARLLVDGSERARRAAAVLVDSFERDVRIPL